MKSFPPCAIEYSPRERYILEEDSAAVKIDGEKKLAFAHTFR